MNFTSEKSKFGSFLPTYSTDFARRKGFLRTSCQFSWSERNVFLCIQVVFAQTLMAKLHRIEEDHSLLIFSSFAIETCGPARAVTVHSGDCWKCGSHVMPQVFECSLPSPKPVGQLLLRVTEGLVEFFFVVIASFLMDEMNIGSN